MLRDLILEVETDPIGQRVAEDPPIHAARTTVHTSMPLAPSSPPMATRITVEGRNSETKARLSPKASRKATGAAHAWFAWTKATIASM